MLIRPTFCEAGLVFNVAKDASSADVRLDLRIAAFSCSVDLRGVRQHEVRTPLEAATVHEEATQERLARDGRRSRRRPEGDHVAGLRDVVLLEGGRDDGLSVGLAVHARGEDERDRGVDLDDLARGGHLEALGIFDLVEHSNPSVSVGFSNPTAEAMTVSDVRYIRVCASCIKRTR